MARNKNRNLESLRGKAQHGPLPKRDYLKSFPLSDSSSSDDSEDPTPSPFQLPTLSPPTTKLTNQPSRFPVTTTIGPTVQPTTSPVPVSTIGEWQQVGNDLKGDSGFGWDVALSADGAVLAVGAPNNGGLIRVYRWIPGANRWFPRGSLIGAEQDGDLFGNTVALSTNGNIVAGGAFGHDGNGGGAGHVRVFQYNPDSNAWIQLGQSLQGEGEGDFFGNALALSSDGLVVAVGAPGHGGGGQVRIYQYDMNAGIWQQLGQSIEGDEEIGWYYAFGEAVSLSEDGKIVAIGAEFYGSNGSQEGQVRIYQYDDNVGVWQQLGQNLDGAAAGDEFGVSVDLSADGTSIAVGAPGVDSGKGTVYVFKYTANLNVWEQVGQELRGDAVGGVFGISVALSADGSIIAAGESRNFEGGPAAGRVHTFRYHEDSDAWQQRGQNLEGEEREEFGFSVALSSEGNIVAAGSSSNTNNKAVRVFEFKSS